jgi:pimeloyl-ACP methyl ester carboxylesterase
MRRQSFLQIATIAAAFSCLYATTAADAQASPSAAQPVSSRATMIPVAEGVQLEVLDWGGTGRPLVLLTGLGNEARSFDPFAQKLTARYHVYGITRRGFGKSSAPQPDATNYSTTRLGEDVIAVIDALHLKKPVVAGHSIAGEELSYIAVHHPEKVAGLVYLDAGYPYALYDEVNGALSVDVVALRDQLEQVIGYPPADPVRYLSDLEASLQRVEKEVAEERQDMERMVPPYSGQKLPPIATAILNGAERFTTFHVPALVIFADPHDLSSRFKDDRKDLPVAVALDLRDTERQAKAFERQVPSAHVVRIPDADHTIFRSNEADVLREMDAFIGALPQE